MAHKRKQHDTSSSATHKSKRSRPSHPSAPRDASQGYLDHTTGMRGAIPGLDDFDEGAEDENADPVSVEALRYLRGVR